MVSSFFPDPLFNKKKSRVTFFRTIVMAKSKVGLQIWINSIALEHWFFPYVFTSLEESHRYIIDWVCIIIVLYFEDKEEVMWATKKWDFFFFSNIVWDIEECQMCPYHNLLEKLEQCSVLNMKESLHK